MSKVVLSGDLGVFRLDLLIRLLEAVKATAEIQIESRERALLGLSGGRLVSASTASQQGFTALQQIVTWRQGGFGVRVAENPATQPDFQTFQNNAAIFQHLQGLMSRGPVAPSPQPAAVLPPSGGQPSAGPPGARPAPPAGASTGGGLVVAGSAQGQAAASKGPFRAGAGAGPLARVPELTDKGRVTLRTIQTNFAMRGVQVEGDKWRFLAKVDGQLTLYQIGQSVNILGEKLIKLTQEVEQEGMLRFVARDDVAEQFKSQKFRLGEYMVAKGIITDVQLEAALRRQSELARKGRYMWLGEILVEMNYARPSQVQEAMAIQKKFQQQQQS
ncbi:MAG: hypothetical protein VKO21_08585 [Candidatus Sericytochromatia bacterium]|nr:hypothetical protein [Candidatus Sericytochromatia bacterium]